MANLKSNILFNFVGNAWLGLLTLIVTPIQIGLLGIEAFGFVGLITILQVLLGSLDLGISATVTKVVSADRSVNHINSVQAVNTASTIYWLAAIIIAVLLWCSSELIAQDWLKRTKLDPLVITSGVQLVAVYLGLRWPIAFYAGVISGLQRMDLLNLIKATVQTTRLGGSIVVLFIRPELTAFLIWFAISAGFELLLFYIVTRRLFPKLRLTPYFSLVAFKNIWKYSAAMNLIGLTALALSQADRVVVTQILGLQALGYYSVAHTAAMVVSLIQNAINSASFSAFSHAFSHGGQAQLAPQYNKTSQLMCLIVTLPCCALVFFGHIILKLWIDLEVADATASTMALLAVGFWLNAVVSSSSVAASACGFPSIALKANLRALTLYLPILCAAAYQFGIVGVASCYAGLNCYYLFDLLPTVQQKVIKQNYARWLGRNCFPFLSAGIIAFGSGTLLMLVFDANWQVLLLMITSVLAYVVFGWMAISPDLRKDLTNTYKQFTRQK